MQYNIIKKLHWLNTVFLLYRLSDMYNKFDDSDQHVKLKQSRSCVIANTNVSHDEVGKGAHEPKAQTAGAYPGYLSMKHA